MKFTLMSVLLAAKQTVTRIVNLMKYPNQSVES